MILNIDTTPLRNPLGTMWVPFWKWKTKEGWATWSFRVKRTGMLYYLLLYFPIVFGVRLMDIFGNSPWWVHLPAVIGVLASTGALGLLIMKYQESFEDPL